jgi:hypothetical protein
MTQQRDDGSTRPEGAVAPAAVSRRTLLRGAAIAAPTLVTMNTASAALALSSVRTYTSIDRGQPDGNYYCLAENTTLGPPISGNPNALQVNSTTAPTVYRIPERDYRTAKNNGAPAVTEVQMCRNSASSGTPYYYKPSGGSSWSEVRVKRGVLMSATAMSSVGMSVLPLDNV